MYGTYNAVLLVKDYPIAMGFNLDTTRGFITASRLAEMNFKSPPGFKLEETKLV